MAIFNYKAANGDVLPLSAAQNYKLVNIDAQTAVNTSIASVTTGGVDGDAVNNIQAQARTIILDIRIINDVERTKRQILNVIKLKQRGALIWQQDERTLEIHGIIEAVEMPRWNNAVTMQITLHCEQPFWENVDYIVSKISEAIDLHYFTDRPDDMLFFPGDGIPLGEYDTTRSKTFNNTGDVAVGMEIVITALGTVTNPIIYDATGAFFGVGYGTGNKRVIMQAGDVMTINTRRNEKTVKLNGVSMFSKIKPASTWLQLPAGVNQFAINSDDDSLTNMQFSLIYKQRYI